MIEINLPNRAAAQTTLAYNSACMFDGVPLGATSAGLYRVGGYTDHGTAIPALVKSGAFDLGTPRFKGFRYFYFGIDATGDLELSIFCDGELVASYSVDGGTSGYREVRVPIGRGARGRYWQWQVKNKSGAFFVLYSVQAMPVFLRTIR